MDRRNRPDIRRSASGGVIRALLLLLFSAVLTSCASHNKAALPPLREAELYPRSQSIAGLTIAVDEISDPERARHYFGSDLTREGVLPVNIIVSNQGDDKFVVRPQDVLMLEGNSTIDPMPVESVEKMVKGGDMQTVAFRETTVAPQNGYQGVLFFRIPKQDKSLYGKVDRIFSGGLTLRVAATDQSTGERLLFGPFTLSGL